MCASTRCVAFRFLLLLLIMQSAGAGRHVNGQSYHQPVASAITTGEVNCNDLFTVDRENYYQKRYEGTLQLKSDVTLRDVEIDLRFDRQVDLLVNYFGVAGSVNNRDFRISKSGYKHFAHALLKLKLEVSYSTSSPPRLEEVRLNGIVVCPVKFVSRTSASTEPTTPVYRYPPNSWSLNPNPVPLLRPSAIGNVPSFQPIQQPVAAVPRNFTDERENRFNSTCAGMSPNIIITPGRWDGELTLHTDVAVDRVQIEIVFDRPVYVLGNLFGEVHTLDGIRFVIENGTLALAADAEVKLNFFVKFNENGRIPDVQEVNFNDRDLCRQRVRRVSATSEASVGFFGTRSTTTERAAFEWVTTPKSESEEEYDESDCATAYPSSESLVQARIIGGTNAKSGEIPWHVAIYYDDQYQCGGSIISRRNILTAAHCLTKENSNETLEMDLFKVYIGIVDIGLIDDYFFHTAEGATIHRDYNSATQTTDIGILKLKRDIIFNNFIKPVCLYRNTTDISSFYNRYGKVAGWGINRNGVVTNILNYLDMPVVSQKKCSQTNIQYNTVLAFGESFCAGHADGNSVCNGDSGGGLVFVDEYRYYLRGIVSISAQKRNQLMCDPNRYSVFTDVSKFLKWIRQNID